jgi:serine kinase of HPr protein (carbohydrate metabolism regulator)
MQSHPPVLIHATAVVLPADTEWAGVLLRGPLGSGKSDLALSLIAYDKTELCQNDGELVLRTSARPAGRMGCAGWG